MVPTSAAQNRRVPRARTNPSRRLPPQLLPYLLLTPAVLVLLGLLLVPLVQGLVFSFQAKRFGELQAPFIGLDNYATLFGSHDFRRVAAITTAWTLGSTLCQLVVGLVMAVLLDQDFKGRVFFRGFFILPWILPPIVVAVMWQWMFNDLFGVVNQLLLQWQVVDVPVPWFSSPDYALPMVIGINVWRGAPLAMVILLAGLQGVSRELRDAARIDGASPIQEFLHVALPALRRPMQVILLIFTMWNFTNFDIIFLTTHGGPGISTTTFPVLAYRTAVRALDAGQGSAIAVLMFLVLLVVVTLYWRLHTRVED